MESIEVVKSILTEYGVPWAVNRGLYSLKLRLLNTVPFTERWFEHSVGDVQSLDIFELNTNAITSFLKTLDKQTQENLISRANLAAEGKIYAFSSVLLDYGNPVRWNYNPLTEKYVSLDDKWFEIADFQKERGDIKVIWEASRFSHFYLFSKAYLLTGDRKYYEAFHNQITDWVEKNTYSYGPNYKCGQECSLRLVNTLMNYTIFRQRGLTDERDISAVKQIVKGSYKKILSNFFYAYKCIKNNHTISELLGMIIGAWCCGTLKQMTYGYQKMDEVIKDQFFEDGGYKQYSFNYQRLALQDIACLISVSNKTGLQISDESKRRVLKSARLLYQMLNIDGDVPNYGSNDGALVFPVTECEYRDYRPVIQCINGLLTGERILKPGVYDEELLWFTGKPLDGFSVKEEKKHQEAYEDAGIYSIISGKEKLFIFLNDYKSRPGHCDQMHLDLWAANRNVLCDSGTYSYADEIGKQLASTIAHNTIKITGKEQMNHKGAFFNYGWTKRGKVANGKDYFVGSMYSANGYIHNRRVKRKIGKIGSIYEITDIIQSNFDGIFEVLFHTPYDVREVKEGIVISDLKQELCVIRGTKPHITICKRSLFYMNATEMYCISFHGKIENGKAVSKVIIEMRDN